MKYRLTFCILLLLFVAGSMSLIMAQTPQWITASESQSETNTWLGFKKDFVVSSVPQVLKARIAVDSKYWLWLNDKLIVFEGGVKRGPNRNDTYFDSIDLAPYLKQGDNTIAVLVWYFGKQGFSHNPSGQAALFFDAESPELSLVSDETWTAFVHPAYYTPLGEKPNFRLSESNLKSATKLFSVLLASKRPLITELADKLRLKYPLLPTISPCPTMRLEAIRSIIPISCRRYPKSV